MTLSGAMSVRAVPISPIIQSRPMVGVENRLRTTSASATMASVILISVSRMVIQLADTPS